MRRKNGCRLLPHSLQRATPFPPQTGCRLGCPVTGRRKEQRRRSPDSVQRSAWGTLEGGKGVLPEEAALLEETDCVRFSDLEGRSTFYNGVRREQVENRWARVLLDFGTDLRVRETSHSRML